MEVMLNYFMRTPSNIINETNSSKFMDDHIVIPQTGPYVYMAMCKFHKNKITFTMDKNFNADVVSATKITFPIKLYLCLIISNISVASSEDN